MKVLENICEILEDELKEIVRNGDMSPTVLDNTYKAVDIIKDIKTIDAMENATYDGRYSYGDSYGWDDDYSMATRPRTMRPDNRRMDYRDRGYSREDEREHLMAKIDEMKRRVEQLDK